MKDQRHRSEEKSPAETINARKKDVIKLGLLNYKLERGIVRCDDVIGSGGEKLNCKSGVPRETV